MKQQLTWIGLSVDDYIIDSELSEGPLSWVYGGFHKDGLGKAAFKVAKPPDLVESADHEQISLTQSIAIWSGFTQKVHPDAFRLLSLQAQKLNEIKDPGLVRLEDLHDESNFVYLRLELIEGQTLRDLMGKGFVDLKILIEIAEIMSRLEAHSNWKHGNLKPENLIVTDAGVKVIDPGYFGQLNCHEGENLNCAVTTTAYYPLLTPDDILAFGIILWEIATKQHPLFPVDSSTEDNFSTGSNLTDWVEEYQSVGQHFLSPIVRLRRPSDILPNVSPLLEILLLKALQLKVNDDNLLDREEGFATFTELANALLELQESGLDRL